jgi:ABC-type nickel/cobalt efflux system permease component RcnA
VAFSLGLASTLSALGLAVVYAGRLSGRLSFTGRAAAVLPAISAVVIVAAGLALTVKAVPEL